MAESKRKAAVREAANEVKERCETNPFLSELAVTTRTKKIKKKLVGMTVLVEATGQREQAYYEANRTTDTETFTKLYAAGRATLRFLTAPGLLVFEYLLDRLQPGNAVVYLDRDEFVGHGHGRHTYYGGINELLALRFVARSTRRGWYFINPSFFFNGNRLVMRHDFSTRKTAKTTDAA